MLSNVLGVLEAAGAAARRLMSLAAACLVATALAATLPSSGAHAMKIQKVKSPGGLEAWLVEEHSVPLMALRFSFEGGNAQDPIGKDGLANFITGMLDEGAGDLTAIQFQERVEEIAMRMSFDDARDAVYGSFETLTQYRAKAIELLTLAINKPRFDADAVDRVRQQLQARLAYEARDPDRVAGSNEVLDDKAPDMAGAARYDNSHGNCSFLSAGPESLPRSGSGRSASNAFHRSTSGFSRSAFGCPSSQGFSYW